MLNHETIKKDFPLFEHRPELVYLDSAATAQKPRAVLEAMRTYYEEYTANVSRGLYPMAEMATIAVAEVRERIADFIGSDSESTIFTGGTTHGVNLVTTGLREHIKPGDNIVVSAIEHHSNFLPWKELSSKTGADFRIAEPDAFGHLTPEHILPHIDAHTRVLAFSAVSNVLGLQVPVKEIITAVRKKNPQTLILIDAAQAVGHIPVSLREWDADYLVFSGHKVYGPTGIGVLAGKKKSLEYLGAVNVGGGTVLDPLSTPVGYKPLPDSIEGGTPNIAGIVGLGEAIRYVQSIGLAALHEHDQELTSYAEQQLAETFGEKIHFIGPKNSPLRTSILSFAIDGIHPHDLAHLLGEDDVCIRAGEHCARLLHRTLGVPVSARISLSVFTTKADIDKLIQVTTNALGIMHK